MYLSGLPCPDEYCITGDNPVQKTFEGSAYPDYLMEQLRNLDTLPDVFICANDFIAIDTLQVFKKLGISVPGDVYLCGFDDSPESRIMSPTLTTHGGGACNSGGREGGHTYRGSDGGQLGKPEDGQMGNQHGDAQFHHSGGTQGGQDDIGCGDWQSHS